MMSLEATSRSGESETKEESSVRSLKALLVAAGLAPQQEMIEREAWSRRIWATVNPDE